MTKVRLEIGGTEIPTYVVGLEMCVSSWPEALANEVPQLAEAYKDHVADVGREQDVVGWVLLFMLRDRLADGVLGGEAVLLVRAMTKLRMDGVEDLFGGRRDAGVGKSVIVVVHLGLAFA